MVGAGLSTGGVVGFILSEGESVGDTEGETVGGDEDGDAVGATEPVGDADGEPVGAVLVEGTSVGADEIVGALVLVGDAEGLNVEVGALEIVGLDDVGCKNKMIRPNKLEVIRLTQLNTYNFIT